MFFSLIHDGRLSPFAPVYAFCFTRCTLHAFVLSFLSKSDAAKLATLHAFQCKRITPTPANAPKTTGTHPLNNSKCGEMARPGRHAPEMVLTRNRHGAHVTHANAHTRRTHVRASRTPTHAHMHAHARQRMHTHTRTHAHAHGRAHAHTHTHAPAHTQGPPRPRTRETPNGRHLARGSKCDANALSLT